MHAKWLSLHFKKGEAKTPLFSNQTSAAPASQLATSLPGHHQHQLVQEILKVGPRPGTPPLPATSPLPPPTLAALDTTPSQQDPASQLVTELFESIKLKSDDSSSSKPPIGPAAASNNVSDSKPAQVKDFKAGLRKVNQHPLSHDKQETPSQINFKSQLKKTNTSLYAQPSTQTSPQKEESESEQGPVDFKSQLKKVKSTKTSDTPADHQEKGQDLNSVKASLKSVSKQNIEAEDEDENKRKSTGSISSLKKMWEDGEVREGDQERPGSVVKFEKRVWPPVPSTETEKPMVPVKPTVKPPPTSKPPPPKEPSCKPPPKPTPSAKPMVCNIYAAPNSVPPKPNISIPTRKSKPVGNGQQQDSQETGAADAVTKNGSQDTRADSTDSGLSSTNDKDNLMDLSVSLENLLDSLSKEGITKASAMSASDKVS